MLPQSALAKVAVIHPVSYFLLAFSAMAGLAYINFLPGVVSALAGGIGFSEAEAGQIVALNGYGGLLGRIVAIFLVRKLHWQSAMLTLLALLAVIDLSTAWFTHYSALLAWRFVAGLCGGLSLGIAFAVLARLDNPDRAFGTLLFVQFSIGSLVIYLLPALEHVLGAYAVFYLMAAIAVLALLFLLCLPTPTLTPAAVGRAQALAGAARAGLTQHAVLLLLAIMLYQTAASAIWAYAGLIGQAAGMATASVNNAIALTGLLGLAGAMLPVLTGQRFGRLNLLLAAIVLSLSAALLLNVAGHNLLYIGALAMLFFAWPAVLAYLLAVIAATDSSGRLATIAAVVSSIGMATGPLLASALLDNGNFSALLYSCALLFLCSYVLLFKPVLAFEKPAAALAPCQ